jgi:poly(ADP-ribose) glycohydrolase ARH3
MKNSSINSKFTGALIGSALGDAIGELAFRYAARDRLLKELGNRNELRYTDDTAMAIGLSESILEANGTIESEKLGKTFHRNFNEEPYRGYGSGPPTIFRTAENTGENYVSIAQNLFGGQGSYGNGASMRITPLGIFFYDSDNLYAIAQKSAIVTHSHKLGIDGAAILAKLISVIMKKNPAEYSIENNHDKILEDLIDFAKTREYKSRLEKIRNLLYSKSSIGDGERELGSNVLAITSVPVSIYAFLKNPNNFKDSLLDAVLVSRDRDTVGAMLGGLLGGYLGIEQIPKEWISKLENRSYIKELALNLFNLKISLH